MRMRICLVTLSVSQSVSQSIGLSICMSVGLAVRSVCLFAVFLSVFQPVCLSVFLPDCLAGSFLQPPILHIYVINFKQRVHTWQVFKEAIDLLEVCMAHPYQIPYILTVTSSRIFYRLHHKDEDHGINKRRHCPDKVPGCATLAENRFGRIPQDAAPECGVETEPRSSCMLLVIRWWYIPCVGT